jgi:excisionase family DNA binding protein
MEASELNASWYTVEEIARHLKVSRSNVYKLVESGRLPAHRIGSGRGCIRVAKGDLDAYLESVREAPEVPAAAGRKHSKECHRPTLFKHLDVSQSLSSRR